MSLLGGTSSSIPTHPTAIRSLEEPPSPYPTPSHPLPIGQTSTSSVPIGSLGCSSSPWGIYGGEVQCSQLCQCWGAEQAGKAGLLGGAGYGLCGMAWS